MGRAITQVLAKEGASVIAVGRNPTALAETVRGAGKSSHVSSFRLDLTKQDSVEPLLQHVERLGKLDVLVHGAGVIRQELMERARIEDLDVQYATNVRAPYMLTQRLLPYLTAARGQVVFLNSTVGLAVKRSDIGQYAATKHALRAVADSLREEVNARGIRVLTVFLGRTATPMQEAICLQEGKTYRPEALLQPEDVAFLVLQALTLNSTAEVTDISIRPMTKI